MADYFETMPVGVAGGKMAHYFITCVKLAPGKSALSFMQAIDKVDSQLHGGQRHSRDVHEEQSFVTLGRWDLIIIWRAPDLHTMAQYLQELFAACGSELGNTETLVAIQKGAP